MTNDLTAALGTLVLGIGKKDRWGEKRIQGILSVDCLRRPA